MRYTMLILGLALVAGCEHPGTRDDLDNGVDARGNGTDASPISRDGTAGSTPSSSAPTGATGGTMPTGTTEEVLVVPIDPTAKTMKPAEHLVAILHGTRAHPDVEGVVHLRKIDGGVEAITEVDGLPAGTHLVFVDTYGDCSDPLTSTGSHLDLDALATNARSSSSSMGTHPGMPGSMGSTGSTGSTTGSTGSTGGMTGSTGGMTGSTEGMTGSTGGMARDGNLGSVDATSGRSARTTMQIPEIDTLLGALNGRAVVIEDTTTTDPSKTGTPLACGVIGVARDTSIGTPIDINEDQLPDGQP